MYMYPPPSITMTSYYAYFSIISPVCYTYVYCYVGLRTLLLRLLRALHLRALLLRALIPVDNL
jgi:hypothetical protein